MTFGRSPPGFNEFSPPIHAVASAGGEVITLDFGPMQSAPELAPYQVVERKDSVIIPAGRAEPDALERFAGIMAEVFGGPPLTTDDIDEALRKLRKRG